MRKFNGSSKLYALIGHPVAHSLSPRMQNAALEMCGINAVYLPFDVHPDNLHTAVTGLRAIGCAGFNVTIPHKCAVMPLLDRLDPSALRAGAVNTVHNESGILVGYNTDGNGLIHSLKQDIAFSPSGTTVILFGAGGAARGAAAALSLCGAERIIILNRTLERAQSLVSDLEPLVSGTLLQYDLLNMESFSRYAPEADLLLNTTALGMNGAEKLLGVDVHKLSADAKVYDMVYSPPATPLVVEALRSGRLSAGGLGMLAAQGELAFSLWTKARPPENFMLNLLRSDFQ